MKYLKKFNLILEWGKSSEEDIYEAIVELRSLGSPNPLNYREIVFQFDGEEGIVLLEISRFDNHLWINGIHSTTRNKGLASKVMKKVCEVVDKHNIYVALDAEPFTNFRHKDILSKKQLMEWYKNFGFKSIGGGTMERIPNVIEKTIIKPKEIEPKIKTGDYKFKVDPTYTHFAIKNSDNKIVTGWDYKGLVSDEVKHWSKIDLKDIFPDNKLSDFTVLSLNNLRKREIDPFNWDNWAKM